MADDEVEHLRALLAHAHEKPESLSLAVILRKLTERFKTRKQPVAEHKEMPRPQTQKRLTKKDAA